MEGPTPVSSLIHAAYHGYCWYFLLCRFHFLYFFPALLILIVLIGALTAFLVLRLEFCYGFEKVIAYSTCSQLGYMFFACGLLQFTSAMYHLFIHAFFKVCCFYVLDI